MTFLFTGPGEPFDYESITVSDSSIGLTIAKLRPDGIAPPISGLLSLEDAAIRYRLDGEDPTTLEGHVLASGDVLSLRGALALQQFRAVKDTITSGVLRVTYFH